MRQPILFNIYYFHDDHHQARLSCEKHGQSCGVAYLYIHWGWDNLGIRLGWGHGFGIVLSAISH